MLTICIPSYRREAWLSENLIPNLKRKLLEQFEGKIKVLLMVQDPRDDLMQHLLKEASETPHLKLIITDTRLTCSIAQIRFESFLKGLYHFQENEYVMAMDDDVMFYGDRFIIDTEFTMLLNALKTAPEERTYCIFPGREFKIEPYTHPNNLKQELLPTYLRGHIYHKNAVLALEHEPLKHITVGEDYLFPAILKRPIMKVTGFERCLHFCERTLFKTDILAPGYQCASKAEAQECWDIYSPRFNFKNSGYTINRSTIGYTDYCRFYPEFFTPEGHYKGQVLPKQTVPESTSQSSSHSKNPPSMLSGYKNFQSGRSRI